MRIEAVLHEVLAAHALDRPPVDGDCLTVAPKITQALLARGRDAQLLGIIAWSDPAEDLLRFMHQATLCDTWAADATARQFHPGLPELWAEPIDDYLARWAATVPGVHHVTAVLLTAR